MRKVLFRPFMESPEPAAPAWKYKLLRHPLFAWLRLRPIFAQHTALEHAALIRHAAGKKSIVEIGVAEGASAAAFQEAMAKEGTLYLIDPFHLGRVPGVHAMKRAAHAALQPWEKPRVVWMEKFSHEAARGWTEPIDLLFLDGDHTLEGVRRDWLEWSPFVAPGGLAVFHDARVFPNGWPLPSDGPVRLVNELFREQRCSGWKILDEVHSLVVVERAR